MPSTPCGDDDFAISWNLWTMWPSSRHSLRRIILGVVMVSSEFVALLLFDWKRNKGLDERFGEDSEVMLLLFATKPSQHMSSFPYVAHRMPLGFVGNEQKSDCTWPKKARRLASLTDAGSILVGLCEQKVWDDDIYLCVKCPLILSSPQHLARCIFCSQILARSNL